MKKTLVCIIMLGAACAANAELQPTLSANIGKITSKGSSDSLYWDASVGAKHGRFIFEAGYLDAGKKVSTKYDSSLMIKGMNRGNLRGTVNSFNADWRDVVLTQAAELGNEIERNDNNATSNNGSFDADWRDVVLTQAAELGNEIERNDNNATSNNGSFDADWRDVVLTQAAALGNEIERSDDNFGDSLISLFNEEPETASDHGGDSPEKMGLHSLAVSADTTAEANVKKKTTVTNKISGPKIATGYALPVNQTMDVNFKVGLNWLNNKEVVTTEISRGSDAKEISNETFNTRKLIPSFGVGTSHKLNKSLNLDPGLNCLFLSSFSNQRMKYNNAVNYTLGFTYKI